jgi:putative two-component system hydrogenase maturation factor HypX/HoxX
VAAPTWCWRPSSSAPFLNACGAALCLVVHPGPPGDRGPSALDHAVLEGVTDWGVTVLQAAADFDAGTVWAWQPCTLRAGATKASLYRHEVVQCRQPGGARGAGARAAGLPRCRPDGEGCRCQARAAGGRW